MHPFWVRHVIFPLHERLKGKPTYPQLKALERTQWLDARALRELQFRRLRQHLDFAYREVPYYTRLLDEHGLQPPRVQSFEDFARIPYLTKDNIREHFTELQPRTRFRRAQRMSSGGSTGRPVTVLVDGERTAFGDAARLRAHRWYGVGIGTPEVVLWGSPIELGKQDMLRVIRDRLINSHLLSAFDLGEPALARYRAILQRERPQKIYGYASALYLLARYLGQTGWIAEPKWPRVVFTTAEALYPFQRKTIEAVFGCPAAVEYGCREAGLIANECPSGGLHVPVEGMVVEIVPTRMSNERTQGELVVTNLNSFAMPVLRYRTGDVGAVADTPCQCGRGLPCLRNVEGRRTDFLVTPSGKIMHALAVIYILREVSSIREFQVIQERADQLSLTIVPDATFSEATRDAIRAQLVRLFEGGVSVDIELAAALVRPPSGKYRYVISKAADEYLDSLSGTARQPDSLSKAGSVTQPGSTPSVSRPSSPHR